METELSKVLDECIAQISKGETIQACLAEYPTMRQQLEPLLYTALSISTLPRVSPSDEFRKRSKARLMAWLRKNHSEGVVMAEIKRTTISISWETKDDLDSIKRPGQSYNGIIQELIKRWKKVEGEKR